MKKKIRCRLGLHDYESFCYVHPITLEATGKRILVCRRCSKFKEEFENGRKRRYSETEGNDPHL